MRDIKFRAWDKTNNCWIDMCLVAISPDGGQLLSATGDELVWSSYSNYEVMQYTGLKDKNGKEIYEGDIVGKEGVYHFIEREGWEASSGNWKIIGEKSKNFTGKNEEKYIAGYELSLVEWVDESCGFEPFSDSRGNCGHCNGGQNPMGIEVIGNIYENPELLK